MLFTKIPQDVTVLNFKPLHPPFPQDIAFVISGLVLSGFDQTSGIFKEDSLGEFFGNLYPTLTLSEWARIFDLLEKSQKTELWPNITKGKMQDEDSILSLKALSQTPDAFQDWVSKKNLSLTELQPLKWSYKSQKTIPSKVFDSITQTSRQEGAAALELIVDLIMLDKEVPEFGGKPETWIESLKSARTPEAAKKDKEREALVQNAMKSMDWPKDIKARWVRMGDQAGLEVRFSAASPMEYEKQLMKLKAKKDELSQIIWTKN
jgi:hypothetical protein